VSPGAAGVRLTPDEKEWLAGRHGEAGAMAMRVVVEAARLVGAHELVEISSAHVDGCLYHGDGGVHFAERLVDGAGRVAVPTTLNVGALDLLHPGRVRASAHAASMARRQMEAYLALGCAPTWTCAPYQAGHRPGPGEQVAWGESNAVAFANSVLGARTERYGDFLDACCAITGRAPLHGLHVEENRRARVVVDVSRISADLLDRDVFFPVFGTWLGLEAGREPSAIVGLPRSVTEDQLKALGAAGASSGAVALFHVVGVTPEAPTLDAVLGPEGSWREVVLTGADLRGALDRLSTVRVEPGDAPPIDAVAVGSPHFSWEEFQALVPLVEGRRLSAPFLVCTGRDVLHRVSESGQLDVLTRAGVEIVVDTCVVVTPILPAGGGVLMTNSGKFAHYGPSTIGYDVVYGSLAECVASAEAGVVRRDADLWR